MDEEEAFKILKEHKAEQEKKKTGNKGKAAKKKSMTPEERREVIRNGLIKKKECEAKALTIVERLTEKVIKPEWLRDAANFINPSYYDDVVDERNCVKLCGYPLCSNELNRVLKQKYRISAKENKVYDITERKKFCSDICFKSSNFVQEQIPSSPLWLREKSDFVRLQYLHETKSNQATVGSKGTEVFVPILTKQDIDQIEATNDILKPEQNDSDDNQGDICEELAQLSVSGKGINEKTVIKTEANDGENNAKTAGNKSDNEHIPNTTDQEAISAEKSIDQNCKEFVRTSKKMVKKQENPCQDKNAWEKVKLVLMEWFTIDTLRTLEGDDYVRTRIHELVDDSDDDPEIKIESIVGDKSMNPEFREKYIELCRKLDMQERLEEKQGGEELSEVGASSRVLDSKKWEQDGERLEAFLKGQMIIAKDSKKQDQQIKEANPDEDDLPIVLPKLDRYAQGAMRRRVVHDQLDRVFPDILKICGGLTKADVRSSLKQLIHTFDFSAENIVMKTREWTLMSIFIIEMLSRFDEAVAGAANDSSSQKYLNLMLLAFDTSFSQVKHYVNFLQSDIQSLITKMHIIKP